MFCVALRRRCAALRRNDLTYSLIIDFIDYFIDYFIDDFIDDFIDYFTIHLKLS